jgi:hypothetical protein
MFVTVRILIKNSIMLPFCSYTSTYMILNYEVLCYMGWQLQDGSMLIGTSVCNVISLNPEVGGKTPRLTTPTLIKPGTMMTHHPTHDSRFFCIPDVSKFALNKRLSLKWDLISTMESSLDE